MGIFNPESRTPTEKQWQQMLGAVSGVENTINKLKALTIEGNKKQADILDTMEFHKESMRKTQSHTSEEAKKNEEKNKKREERDRKQDKKDEEKNKKQDERDKKQDKKDEEKNKKQDERDKKQDKKDRENSKYQKDSFDEQKELNKLLVIGNKANRNINKYFSYLDDKSKKEKDKKKDKKPGFLEKNFGLLGKGISGTLKLPGAALRTPAKMAEMWHGRGAGGDLRSKLTNKTIKLINPDFGIGSGKRKGQIKKLRAQSGRAEEKLDVNQSRLDMLLKEKGDPKEIEKARKNVEELSETLKAYTDQLSEVTAAETTYQKAKEDPTFLGKKGSFFGKKIGRDRSTDEQYDYRVQGDTKELKRQHDLKRRSILDRSLLYSGEQDQDDYDEDENSQANIYDRFDEQQYGRKKGRSGTGRQRGRQKGRQKGSGASMGAGILNAKISKYTGNSPSTLGQHISSMSRSLINLDQGINKLNKPKKTNTSVGGGNKNKKSFLSNFLSKTGLKYAGVAGAGIFALIQSVRAAKGAFDWWKTATEQKEKANKAGQRTADKMKEKFPNLNEKDLENINKSVSGKKSIWDRLTGKTYEGTDDPKIKEKMIKHSFDTGKLTKEQASKQLKELEKRQVAKEIKRKTGVANFDVTKDAYAKNLPLAHLTQSLNQPKNLYPKEEREKDKALLEKKYSDKELSEKYKWLGKPSITPKSSDLKPKYEPFPSFKTSPSDATHTPTYKPKDPVLKTGIDSDALSGASTSTEIGDKSLDTLAIKIATIMSTNTEKIVKENAKNTAVAMSGDTETQV